VFNFVSPAIAENYGLTTMIHEDGHHLAMSHRHLAASFLAKGAYDQIRKGARQAGVKVVGSHEGWEVDEPGSAAAAAAKVEEAATVDRLGPRSHRFRD
jgi:hypothetical protein